MVMRKEKSNLGTGAERPGEQVRDPAACPASFPPGWARAGPRAAGSLGAGLWVWGRACCAAAGHRVPVPGTPDLLSLLHLK